MAKWSDYLTAVQLMAGLNIALYGLPELRQPGLAREQSNQHGIVELANRMGFFELGVEFRDRFRRHWGRLDEHFASARAACIVMSVIAAGVVLWGSGERAQQTADAQLAWISIVAGFGPAAWLAVLNVIAHRRIAGARDMRNQMEVALTRAPPHQALRSSR